MYVASIKDENSKIDFISICWINIHELILLQRYNRTSERFYCSSV